MQVPTYKILWKPLWWYSSCYTRSDRHTAYGEISPWTSQISCIWM